MVGKRDLDIMLGVPADWEKLRGCTVLVTGAAGRIGRYILAALTEIDRRLRLGLRLLALVRNGTADTLSGPVLELRQDITEPIAYEGRIDYIIHGAGSASPVDITRRPVETLWGHVQGTRNVLELARTAGARRVLYISTAEVYGHWQEQRPVREDDRGPLDHAVCRACYPEAKRVCETMLAGYRAQYGVAFVTVRMSHTVGPGISLTDGRAFAEFLRCALQGEDIRLRSDGSAVRTYTYTADAVGALLLALLNGQDDCYNVAAAQNRISVGDLARLIASLAPGGGVRVLHETEQNGGQLSYLPFRLGLMDTARIEALGWRAQVDLEETFRRTMDSMMEQK